MGIKEIRTALKCLQLKSEKIEERDVDYIKNASWILIRQKQDRLYVLLADKIKQEKEQRSLNKGEQNA